MVTHFLSNQEVGAYLSDLLLRLKNLSPAPTMLCPMTTSGTELLKVMIGLFPKLAPQLTGAVPIVPIGVNDASGEVLIDPTSRELIRGQHIFLLDGAIHSGRMMNLCSTELVKLGAAGVCTYSLVIKRSSAFIPTFWSLMMDDTDRAFFLLNEIPNHRLHSGNEKKSQAYVHLRRLTDDDVARPPVVTGVNAIDRVTWGDRRFNMKTTPGRGTYLIEAQCKAVGFLTVTLTDDALCYIDEVAVERDRQGTGHSYGPIMLRFADTLARHYNCRAARLYAIDNRVEFYRGFGYEPVASAAPIPLDANTYHLMQRPILYHMNVDPGE